MAKQESGAVANLDSRMRVLNYHDNQKQMGIIHSPYKILQILSVTPFNKTPLFTLFCDNFTLSYRECGHKQLVLFDL
jgi:hypothetical protein